MWKKLKIWIFQKFWFFEFFLDKWIFIEFVLKFRPKTQENFRIIKKLSNILKSVLEYQKSVWYSEIEVSIGRSLKKLKWEKPNIPIPTRSCLWPSGGRQKVDFGNRFTVGVRLLLKNLTLRLTFVNPKVGFAATASGVNLPHYTQSPPLKKS